MDSTQTGQSTPPRLEDLARRTARALLLPYIINYASTHGPSDEPREVAVIVNPRTGSLTMIDGDFDGTPLRGKDGLIPASKESIDAMPTIQVGELGFDCAICLSEFEIGEEAKQMPCKHKFHAGCIDKWLGIQGSCPVCRYRMPVEGGEEEEKEGVGDSEDREADESAEEEEEEAEEESAEDGEGEAEGGILGLGRVPTFVFHIYFAGRGRNRTSTNPGGQSRENNHGSEANESEDDSGGEGNETEGEEEMEVDSGSVSSSVMGMDIDGNDTP